MNRPVELTGHTFVESSTSFRTVHVLVTMGLAAIHVVAELQ